ncbi:MAG TPA: amino acid adenylation domain-containing protein [Kofleriaceae bacterium]
MSLQSLVGLDQREVLARIRRDADQPFDLARGPLCRLAVFDVGDAAYVLLTAHNVVLDGTSAVIVVQDLIAAYRALVAGEPPALPAAGEGFERHVAHEAAQLAGPDAAVRVAYWHAQLAGPLPVLALPADRPRTAATGARGATLSIELPDALGTQLAGLAGTLRMSRSTAFLAVYQLVLRAYTGCDDVIVGMPISGRRDPRFARTVGYFVNMLAIRGALSDELPVRALCAALHRAVLDGLAHDHPFAAVVRALGLSGEDAPVFSVAFMYQDWHDEASWAGGGFAHVPEIRQEGEYELVLEVVEPSRAGLGYALHWKYDPARFDRETIAAIAHHYLFVAAQLTARLAGEPGLTVGGLAALAPDDREAQLVTWNATAAAYPAERGVHALFATQAAARPDAPAVSFAGATLSYAALAAQVRQLARHLAACGAGPGARVAIYLDRSDALVVALLATLEAGAAYVPLDPTYPRDRVAYILDHAGAALVIGQAARRAELAELCGERRRVVLLDADAPAIAAATATPRPATADDLAYVIYTSGSTGAPKGVMVPHRALTNFLWSMAREPGLTAADRLLAVTTHSFDIAALELYLPLVTGAHCHVADSATARDATALAALIARVAPTVMQATPSTWTMLCHAGWRNAERVRVLCGGEAMPEPLRDQLVAIAPEVWNMFGPTETTVWSTVARVAAGERVSIGRPIANTQCYIVGPHGRLVPRGAAGELCIAGDGLARGYLDQPALTAERFTDHPFVPGARWYRTGDRARWLADGTIEYLGRLDHQVKIRGFRVELGEIEHVLAQHPGVREAAVIARAQAGSHQLIAYYTAAAGPAPAAGELERHLQRKLPDYMVPALVLALDALPQTPNGKADRKALAARDVALPVPSAPAAADEAAMVAIWRDALGVVNLGPGDRFLDAGGSSVLAAVLADRLARELGARVTPAEVFRHASAGAMAAHLRGSRAPAAVPAAHAPDDGVAIIGVSCRLPGADDVDALWRNLLAGHEAVERLTDDELRRRGVDEPRIRDPRFVAVQSSLTGRGAFDAEFFQLSARDAELLDPQARLLLQHAWKAVEDAGYRPRELADAAVFVSTAATHYQAPLAAGHAERRDAEALVGFLLGQPGTIATLISHRLGLTGPSLFVHSNCSSSLAGLALAVDHIRAGRGRHAVVGGATVHGEDAIGYLHHDGMTLSADGRCRPFDADASGMVGGEGAVVVVLKAAADAVRDGDPIYAIIRGAAINNDGADKAGYYAPSVAGQAAVVTAALDRADLAAESIQYVEAHGTGTRLGDPIEVMALADAYRRHTAATGYCGLGSIKSNLGHLDVAAGLVGCVKAALVVRDGVIPPTLHFRAPNPQIDFAGSPFFVVDRVTPLAVRDTPARAAVSSFGIGGTNVHAVLEAAPAAAPRPAAPGPHVIPLSARGAGNLARHAAALADALSRSDTPLAGAALADIAYTLQVGRVEMAARAVFVVEHRAELITALRGFVAGHAPAVIADRRLAQLAQLWIGGASVDWQALHAGAAPRRVHLPSYPFTEDHYWLSQPAARVADPAPAWFTERWVPRAAAVGEAFAPGDVVVALASSPAHQDELRRLVAARGAQLVCIAQPGAAGDHVAAYDDVAGLTRAFAAIAARHRQVRAVCELWPVEDVRRRRDPGAVAGLVQAVVASGLAVAQLVVAGAFADPIEQARLDAQIGYARSLAHVAPGLALRVVLHDGPAAAWGALIAGELAQPGAASALYRDGQRQVCQVQPIAIAATAGSVVVAGATYVIAGGLGGLGRRIAEHLATRRRANLIVIGRSAPAAADAAWLAELERGGVRAVYWQLDLADAAGLRARLAERPAALADVRGVIHAAGVADARSLLAKPRAAVDAALRAKLDGTLALERAVRDAVARPVDFVCLFASTAATLGDFGSGDYAVANRFQAAYARALRDADPASRVIAIGWPLWDEGGMGAAAQRQADPARLDGYLAASAQRALDTATGLALFEAALASGQASPLVVWSPRAAELVAAIDAVSVEETRAAARRMLAGPSARAHVGTARLKAA